MQRLADILIFVGPSGSGKSTLINHLLQSWPQYFGFCTSHTTRKPRPGEVAGKHYYFVEKDTFRQMINEGRFVEYNRVFGKRKESSLQDEMKANDKDNNNNNNNNNNNHHHHHHHHHNSNSNNDSRVGSTSVDDADYYGTSKKEMHAILSQNKVVVMDTDITGAQNIKKYCLASAHNNNNNNNNNNSNRPLRVMVVFVRSPDITALERRLRLRGSESDASLRLRLRENQNWLAWYAANPDFFQHVFLNNKLELCLAELRRFVFSRVLAPTSKM
ncbi:Guanylate kinase/L-type calcium channel beta subunit [Trypanosoma melophagium]|uniref:Guanylate kinase/L-type calcium channel beta subunit n=1 Tax=Trypanosoma melophagium TaxID=715481 RepID=UPI00351A6E92|nr:Guanylate kinase/L-type calcium channel beta subunit [Trypanosoma melophagium]